MELSVGEDQLTTYYINCHVIIIYSEHYVCFILVYAFPKSSIFYTCIVIASHSHTLIRFYIQHFNNTASS